MAKKVLLARPHPFIVSEMKPFLEKSGFAATALGRLDDLQAAGQGASGVIISLAVSSSVGESAEKVFAEVRRQFPRLPVVFAALLPLEKSSATVTRATSAADGDVKVLGVSPEAERDPGLGKPEVFLYISKDDVASTDRRTLAGKILQRHFR